MPKITPSALITNIQGRWAGTTFQNWKGAIVTRATPNPRQSQARRHALYKGVTSTLAGCYGNLTNAQKTSWICYAAQLSTQMTGFNAFLSRNAVCLMAEHASLDIRFNAPPTPTTPSTPLGILIGYCSGNAIFTLSWASPLDICYYLQGAHAPQAGYSNLNSPSWRMISTIRADIQTMSLDASDFPAGTVFRFRLRTLDIHGQVSTWSETNSKTRA